MLTKERYERVLQAACAAGMPFKDITMADTQVSDRARNNAAKSYYFNEDEELTYSRRSLCDITGLKNGKKGFVLTSSYLYSSEFDNKRKNRVVRLPLYNMAGVEAVDEAADRYAVNYKDGGRIEFHLSKHKEGVFALLNRVMEDDAAVTDPEALCQKGRDLYNEGEYEQAFAVFLDAAQVGHARSQWWVGNCCANEKGFVSGWKDEEGFHSGTKDYWKANIWYDLAARQGDPLAQRSLAYNFLTGRGIRKDVQAAQYWYARAAEEYKKEAEEGDPSAMFWMGIFYRNGWGVEEDSKQAFYWFKKAADLGHETSQFLTAERLYYGRGTDRDVQLAKTYAQKAKDIVCWDGDRLLSLEAEKLLKKIDEEEFPLRRIEVSDRKPVTFGTYAQEPIEWLPLAERKGMTLLISRYYLANRPFDRYGNAGWHNSSLRKWLNEDFYQAVFTEKEKEKIQETELENDYSSTYEIDFRVARSNYTLCTGVDESTRDRIFLLSVDEAAYYFAAPGKRAKPSDRDANALDLGGNEAEAYSKPTRYAAFHKDRNNLSTLWWLRTPGVNVNGTTTQGCACTAGNGAYINLCGTGVKWNHPYVRPAMWVKL